MKGKLRRVYLDLLGMMPCAYGLCNICKYADWSGYSCCEAELDCQHPLEVISDDDHAFDTWSGGDCWGFRPTKSLQQIGVAVSIMVDGNNAHWSKSKGEYIAIKPSENDIKNNIIRCLV
jgi:hypothetical protein